jgi:hypothetical protein
MPKLLTQVRQQIRTLRYSLRTEEAYVYWAKDYIRFHHKRHPSELKEQDIRRWLSHLATERKVAASTQNQALSCHPLSYREVLNVPLDWTDNIALAMNSWKNCSLCGAGTLEAHNDSSPICISLLIDPLKWS